MISDFRINLGGVERCLRFNNFATIEIAKLLFDGKIYTANPNEVLDRLENIGNENSLLLMKYLIYGGILGYDYEKGFRATITQEEVGSWIANITEADLLGIWDYFLDSFGVGITEDDSLTDQNVSDSELKPEKKK